jgi:hypothetical protein
MLKRVRISAANELCATLRSVTGSSINGSRAWDA